MLARPLRPYNVSDVPCCQVRVGRTTHLLLCVCQIPRELPLHRLLALYPRRLCLVQLLTQASNGGVGGCQVCLQARLSAGRVALQLGSGLCGVSCSLSRGLLGTPGTGVRVASRTRNAVVAKRDATVPVAAPHTVHANYLAAPAARSRSEPPPGRHTSGEAQRQIGTRTGYFACTCFKLAVSRCDDPAVWLTAASSRCNSSRRAAASCNDAVVCRS